MDSTDLAAAWHEDGYVRLPGLLSPTEASALLDAVQRARPLDPGPNPLDAGPMEFRTNLFPGSPEVRALISDPRVVEVLCALLGPDVWCRWDQAVVKRAGAGWFPWHQDNGYTQRDAVHVQLWIALTRSATADGGLQVLPGAHDRVLPHRWEGGHAVAEPEGEPLAIEAGPGDAVAFSSLLPHATGPNVSGEDRWAYVAEFLPLSVDDPTVPTPHFVVARGGRPAPAFEPVQMP